MPPMSVPAPTPPNDPENASACTLFLSPLSFASILTAPEDPIDPVAPTIASTFVLTVAEPTAPVTPMTLKPATMMSAVATFSPMAWTVVDDELAIVPSTRARVSPVTKTNGTRIASVAPPAVPPGVNAVAMFETSLFTRTAPLVVMLAVDVTIASVDRPLLTREIVRPAATASVAMFSVFALAECSPPAVTLMPPDPSGPCAPDDALVVPSRLTNDTAPPIPTPPAAAIEIARVGASMSSVAVTLMWPTVPTPPSVTFPMLAVLSPSTFVTAMAAPVVNAPVCTPMPNVLMVRSAVDVTSIPPPARPISARSSMCARCVPVSLRTATSAPIATNPPEPANPMPVKSSCIVASTLTTSLPPLPAVTFEPGPICASVALCTLVTTTAAPTPTNPPATAPARLRTLRSSFARTRTLCPATIVPLIAANVPGGTVVLGVRARAFVAELGSEGAALAMLESVEDFCAATREFMSASLSVDQSAVLSCGFIAWRASGTSWSAL